METKRLSIVVPVFNEEEILPQFYQRTSAAMVSIPHEILFLDDGSSDRSWQIISELSRKDSRVRGLSFSRNFGHQAALTAGLEHATGDAVVLIDADLQDPPELIPQMVQKWLEGYDVVYGVRTHRKGETFFKKITATIFYQLLRKTSPVDIPLETGDFRLMSRRVVDGLNHMPERVRFLRGLSSWVGFRQTGIPYDRDERSAGVTKFPLFRMLKFASDGVTSFSIVPLQLASYLGLLATTISLVIGIWTLLTHFLNHDVVRGWPSLMIGMTFLGGIQLLMIGIIGEYIGRIYEEVKQRPFYLIKEQAGSSEKR